MGLTKTSILMGVLLAAALAAQILSQDKANGGLGFGTVGTSALFLVIILAVFGYLSISRRET